MIKSFLGCFILLVSAVYAEEAPSGISVNKKHRVVDGDTLWAISGKYYNDSFKWGRIYNSNLTLIKNPDLILPGMDIEIPDIKETVKPEMNQPVASMGALSVPSKKEDLTGAGAEGRNSPSGATGAGVERSDTIQPFQQVYADGRKEVGYLPAEQSEVSSTPVLAVQPVQDSETPIISASEIERNAQETEERLSGLDLNENLPEGQITFATMAKTLKVDKNFFDGEILYKDAEDEIEREGFAAPGDSVKVKIYSSENVAVGDMLIIYQKGVQLKDGMTAQYAGLAEILELDGKKASCKVLKANTAVDRTMFVKKMKKKVKAGN